MRRVIPALASHARSQPLRHAIVNGRNGISIRYCELHAAVSAAAAQLHRTAGGVVALALANGPSWVIADLALLASGLPCVPVPAFFTPAQQSHALRDAGACRLLTDRPDFYEAMLRAQSVEAVRIDDIHLNGIAIAQFRLNTPSVNLPTETAKVTYTSGTTGTPKGVCLSAAAIEKVADALATATRMTPEDRHLCLLPLSTLLENLGGLYAPLLSGACVLPSAGAEHTDASAIPGGYGASVAAALSAAAATTTIMIPHMLQELVASLDSGTAPPAALRFVAIGGARVASSLLDRAATAGLPVYEGYGLSECTSVIALNTPEAHRRGSVGRPLPHVRIKFSADGEILASGATLLGYTGSTAAGEFCSTGDLGHLDADGFLHLNGRKKDIFITAFGRNVSPDWVESELATQQIIRQACVHGEARPWNAAVIVARPGTTAADISNAIAVANKALPGYAQVRCWLPAIEPFTPDNGQLTANGRLRRSAIAERYASQLNRLYVEQSCEFS